MVSPAPIGIYYPTDALGNVPGGIDAFIRNTLKCAPADLEYTLVGATSDPIARPIGKPIQLELGRNGTKFLPIVFADPTSSRQRMPLVVRYMYALSRERKALATKRPRVLDFHRIEPMALFTGDKRPKNLTVHTDMAKTRDANCDMRWRHAPWIYDLTERWLIRDIDRTFAVSRTAFDRYQKIFPAFAHRFTFLPTIVDTAVFADSSDPADRLRLRQALIGQCRANESSSFLVFVGRLDASKDPVLLLKAFRQALLGNPNLHLVVIGDGSLRAELEATSRLPDLQGKVSLLGVKRPVEIADILRASDLFVLCSAYEGMPIAVLEALAAGLPVVSTRVGEIPGVVRNGVNGQISQERTPEGLANAIAIALAGVAQMRGKPCTSSVEAFHCESVLEVVYDNHRRQAKISS